jgi:hypothetical protein
MEAAILIILRAAGQPKQSREWVQQQGGKVEQACGRSAGPGGKELVRRREL